MTTATSTIMPIDRIDDWDQRLARQDAFWDCAILDRPVVCISLPKEVPECAPPAAKDYATLRDRWLDTERVVECARASVLNTEFSGDALPQIWPNLGPEVFSAFFGCEMEFGESTTWAIPCLKDWADTHTLQFSEDNVYWRKLIEMTDTLLDAGKGLYYTGISDIHTGGDAIAAFRDPQQLNLDMLMAPDEVRALLARVNEAFATAVNFYFDKLQASGQAITSWMGIASTKRWLIPSNDFSCMISKEMFDEVFLPGIIEESENLEAAVYHLDGPDALRHLDSLLDVSGINAIQWVYGAGNGRATDWIPVYQRIQAAGKGIQLAIEPDELDAIMENLKPEGVWMSVAGVSSDDEAQAIIDRVSSWT